MLSTCALTPDEVLAYAEYMGFTPDERIYFACTPPCRAVSPLSISNHSLLTMTEGIPSLFLHVSLVNCLYVPRLPVKGYIVPCSAAVS